MTDDETARFVEERNLGLATSRRRTKRLLEGATIERLRAFESGLHAFEEDWPPPRAFRYCGVVELDLGGTSVRFEAHEEHGDLVGSVRAGTERVDADDISEAAGRRVLRVDWGVDPTTGFIDSVSLELDDGRTLRLFAGELDEDRDGHATLRRGDEMIFLFIAEEDADRLGLAFTPCDPAGA